MLPWLTLALAAAQPVPAADGAGPLLRGLFVLSLLVSVGLAVLAWHQAERLERHTDHFKALLGQLRPLQATLPIVANWARTSLDRRRAYEERKAQAMAAGAGPERLLEIAEETIQDMDVSRMAESIEALVGEQGFGPPAPAGPSPPPLPPSAEEPPLRM